MEYDHYTYLDGVMEKYKPGDYEFDVSQKLRDLHKAKDYGQLSGCCPRTMYLEAGREAVKLI